MFRKEIFLALVHGCIFSSFLPHRFFQTFPGPAAQDFNSSDQIGGPIFNCTLMQFQITWKGLFFLNVNLWAAVLVGKRKDGHAELEELQSHVSWYNLLISQASGRACTSGTFSPSSSRSRCRCHTKYDPRKSPFSLCCWGLMNQQPRKSLSSFRSQYFTT